MGAADEGTGITVLVGCCPEDVAEMRGTGVLHEVLAEDTDRSCAWCLQKRKKHTGDDLQCGDEGTGTSTFMARDPEMCADALRRSIEDDWPGFIWRLISNDRARYLATNRRMRQYGMGGLSVEEWAAKHGEPYPDSDGA